MSKIIIPLNSFSQSEITKEDYENYFQVIKDSGAYGVELRQELFTSQSPPLEWLKMKLEQASLFTVFSSPAPLWKKNGAFNQEAIEKVYYEAHLVRASWIKVSLGHYQADFSDMAPLIEFLEEDRHGSPVQLLVENDQTPYGGEIRPLKLFFEQVSRQSLNIKMTFDTGNWIFVNQDPIEAIRYFAPHVVYVHLKKVIALNNKLVTVPLSIEPSGWEPFIQAFSSETVMALEFPIYPIQTTGTYIDMVSESESEVSWNQ